MQRSFSPDELRKALKPFWDGGRFRLVVLFGSLATGHATPDSDLDLGYLSSQPLDDVALTNEVIASTHWNNVDVVNMHRADPILAMQIAEKGIVLFSQGTTEFTEFQSLAFRRFVDTEKLRVATRGALDRFEASHEPH